MIRLTFAENLNEATISSGRRGLFRFRPRDHASTEQPLSPAWTPAEVLKLNPTWVTITPDGAHVEFGSGFHHFGYELKRDVYSGRRYFPRCFRRGIIPPRSFMPQQSSLKDRVDVLEHELASLKARVDGKPANLWWIELFGVYKDDPLFEEAMKLGAEYRESLRPKPAKKRAGKHVPSGH